MVVLCGFPPYIGKELCKFYPRISLEFSAEWPLFKEKWKILGGGLALQVIHGFLTRTAHFLHQPRPLLHDVGFELVPELGPDHFFISEIVWFAIFVPFVLWSFHPFICTKKLFYSVYLWCKVLTVLVICQTLRVLSFTATQLPGPAHHCREGSPTATATYHNIWDVMQLNVMHGCGDLIFSSHMTFTLTFIVTYTKYGTTIPFKFLAWCLALAQSLLIIASRKHYTVDVVVAWYVVPLVYFFVENRLQGIVGPSDLLERTLSEKILLPHSLSSSSRTSPHRPSPASDLLAHLIGGGKEGRMMRGGRTDMVAWARGGRESMTATSMEEEDFNSLNDTSSDMEPSNSDESRSRSDAVVVEISKGELSRAAHS